MTKVSKKTQYLLGVSALAVMLSLDPVHALTDTKEGRELTAQGHSLSNVEAVHLAKQAKLAVLSLNGVVSQSPITDLPTAITAAQTRLGRSIKFTTDMDTIAGSIDSTLSTSELAATSLNAVASSFWTRLSGSNGNGNSMVDDLISLMNPALDGVASMSGTNLSTFTVTTAASNSGGTISVVGNDGTAGRTYSFAYSAPIATGGTFVLTHGGTGRTITFVNNGGTISSAGALATYLETYCPVNTVLSKAALDKVTALQTLLGATTASNMAGSTASTLTLLGAVTGSDINTKVTNLLYQMDQGVSAMPTAITSMTVSTKAANGGGGANSVDIVFNDGTPAQTYRLADGSSSIASGSTFNLVEVGGGTKTLTLYNRSGGALATQAAFVEYLQNLYPAAAVINPNDTTVIAAVNALLGGTAVGVRSRAAAIWGLLKTTPVTDVSTDLAALRALLVTSLGATLEEDISTVSANLDGVRSMSGLTGFTVSTAAATGGGNVVNVIGNDGTAGRTYSLTYASSIASGATFTLTHSGSGNTITFVNNGSTISSAANLITYLATAYPVAAVMSSTANTKATALQTLLGGSAYSAMGNAATLQGGAASANASLDVLARCQD